MRFRSESGRTQEVPERDGTRKEKKEIRGGGSATTKLQAQKRKTKKTKVMHLHRNETTPDVNVENPKWENPQMPTYSELSTM